MSAFFGARAPELVPEHVQDLNIKPAPFHRNPLLERSPSDLNSSNNGKPTIRLVDSNPNSPAAYKKTPFPKLPSQVLKPTTGRRHELKVFSPLASPEAPAIPPRSPAREVPPMLVPKPLVLKKNRMSASTTTSNADTLVADSLVSPTSFGHSFDRNTQGPISYFGEESQEQGYLQPLSEDSHERTPEVPQLDSEASHYSQDDGPVQTRKESMALSPEDPDELHLPPGRRLRRRSSNSALGLAVYPSIESIAAPTMKPSNESMGESGRSASGASNTPSVSHNIIRYASSSESIRPQYVAMRPATAMSQSASSVWSSDADNIAPLNPPRKRAHMHSASLNSYPSLGRIPGSHLSTIASESEVQTSSRYSNASALASAASAFASANSPPMEGGAWPRRRRVTISSSDYSVHQSSPRLDQVDSNLSMSASSGSRSGDVRSESAIPQPLFSSSVPRLQKPREPSSGRDVDELDDTIGELQSPVLRPQRSGYLTKQRSQTDLRPSSRQSEHSLVETNRWSQGSSIFPQWAKSFYRGNSGLQSANASRVTLGAGFASANASRAALSRPNTRGRHERTETAASIRTRPESSHSNWETIYTASPGSRFVPSIFRPRNRNRAHTDATMTNITTAEPTMTNLTAINRTRSSSLSLAELPGDEIRPVPRTPVMARNSFNPLRSHPPAAAARARTSAQQQRHVSHRSSHFAHPLSVDASYTSFPHLVQNKRLSVHMSKWRVPSIDEPLPRELFARGNRQILAFCLGFIFPPLWIVAAFLALPNRPVNPLSDEFSPEVGDVTEIIDEPKDRAGVDATMYVGGWDWEDERKFLKARWWRTLNRVMSVVGVAIMALIIALAVLAARLP